MEHNKQDLTGTRHAFLKLKSATAWLDILSSVPAWLCAHSDDTLWTATLKWKTRQPVVPPEVSTPSFYLEFPLLPHEVSYEHLRQSGMLNPQSAACHGFARLLSRHLYFPTLGFKMITLFRKRASLKSESEGVSYHRSHHHVHVCPKTKYSVSYYDTCSNKTQTAFYLGTFPAFMCHQTCLEIEPRTIF